MMRVLSFLMAALFVIYSGEAQKIKLLTGGSGVSLRGLSVVNDRILWVSGSNGTVGRSADGGISWKWWTVKGFEKSDFRDIEAFDESTALIMSTTNPAIILRTADGAENWTVVFADTTSGLFLDAMEFWNEQSGIVIGDPVEGKFFIGRTFDGGHNWRAIPDYAKPVALKGEACFASSGTNIRKLNKQEAVFVSGGFSSCFYVRDKKISLPFLPNTETAGANSIAVKDSKNFMVVGGDYTQKDSTEKNCFISEDGGKTWIAPSNPPHGYRSCVEYMQKNEWITCGINGVDYTKDNGKTFELISTEGFHVCRKAKKGKAVFLAGSDGRIGKLEM